MRRIVGALLLLAALAACREPGERCEEEGKVVHYSTGKVLKCEGGRWVKYNGVGATI